MKTKADNVRESWGGDVNLDTMSKVSARSSEPFSCEILDEQSMDRTSAPLTMLL